MALSTMLDMFYFYVEFEMMLAYGKATDMTGHWLPLGIRVAHECGLGIEKFPSEIRTV